MNKVLKTLQAVLLPLIVLAVVIALVIWGAKQLNVPHLHLHLQKINLRTILLASGALLTGAFAVVAAEYTLFNLRQPLLQLLIPVGAFLILSLGCGFFFSRAMKGLPYSYTESMADYRKEFSADAFQPQLQQILPQQFNGTVTGYQSYTYGTDRVETLTVTYDEFPFINENRRIQNLHLPYFIRKPWTCFDYEEGDTLWQIRINEEASQIVYARYVHVEALPSGIPHPMEPDPASQPGGTAE